MSNQVSIKVYLKTPQFSFYQIKKKYVIYCFSNNPPPPTPPPPPPAIWLFSSFIQRKFCVPVTAELPSDGKSCVYNYIAGKAGGLTNLLDEVIKTNMMD